jgi:gamma-glutamyltranspeptidase/glutathione hydrolase
VSGAIAAGHPRVAETGARVLAEGGNAVDACVAAACAAFVAEGPLTGPAGGGFVLVRPAGTEPTLLDCFFAVPSRPLGAMEEVVVDFADASTQSFHVGEGSVAVPGLLAGLEEAHRRFGRMRWRDLVDPAVELAAAGLEVSESQAFLHAILAAILLREDGGRRVYGHRGRIDTTDLVPALEAIRDDGARALARLLPPLAGDLARYAVVEREPVRARFAGTDVLTMPGPSQGGAVVAGVLEELDRLGLGGLPGSGEAGSRLAAALAAGYGATGGTARLTGTTHVSVIDGDRNAAAVSSTLGSGSGVFRHGFQLNNMLGELDVIGRAPRAASERLPSMMAPTIVLDGGRPRLVVGSAGSVRLAGAIAQVIGAVVGQHLPVDEAIERPRLHVDGATVHVEGGVGDEVAARLSEDGWDVVRWSGRNLFFGGVSAVEVRPDGVLAAAGDPRRGGSGVIVG